MSKVELPYTEPMYATYHWMSGAGIPAKQNPTSDIWYYNNTVDWRCGTNFLTGSTSKLNVNLICGSAWTIPFIQVEQVPFNFIKCNPLGVIKDILNNGFYINYCGIDDYYVKGKSGYQEYHCFHDGLIMGYDDDENTFTIAAYDQKHIFRPFKTPQNALSDGINSMFDNVDPGALFPVKTYIIEQTLDIPYISESIRQYLDSDTSAHPPEAEDAVGGMVVYDYYRKYFEMINSGSIHNVYEAIRVLRFAWEHKRCMLKRIIAVENALSLGNEISCKYHKIVEIADNARLVYLKHNIKPSSTVLHQIVDIYSKMKEMEGCLLQEFLSKIQDKVIQ